MNTPGLRPLTAVLELGVLCRAPHLLPYLLARGLPMEDATALAYNATLLACALGGGTTPREVLERYSLAGIARLCERYHEEVAL